MPIEGFEVFTFFQVSNHVLEWNKLKTDRPPFSDLILNLLKTEASLWINMSITQLLTQPLNQSVSQPLESVFYMVYIYINKALYRKYHLIRPNIQNISSLDICFLQCHLLISNSCCCAILQIFFNCQSFCLLICQSYCLFVCLSIYLPPYLLITSLL